MNLHDHIRVYVAKSGGIEKVKELRKVFRGIPRGMYADYVARIGQHENGSQHLISAALLGVVLAEMIYESEKSEMKESKS